MKRFLKIDTDDVLLSHIVNKLNEIGYKNIPDSNGGDNDFIMVDSLRKEYIWCEYGFGPFCSERDMELYEYSKSTEEITLSMLYSMRF